MKKLVIDTEPTAMVFTVDGQPVEWEYDVVTLKIECNKLEEQHGHKPGNAPSKELLDAIVDCLRGYKIPVCSPQIALRVWSLVRYQFDRLAISIATQVRSLDEGQ